MDEKEKNASSPDDLNGADDEHGIVPVETDDEEIAQILEQIPAGKRTELLRVIAASESHSGWLPTPKYLREYDEILPGLAERIVAMPEREQAHRHKVVEQVVADDCNLKKRGQVLAMVSLILLLSVSVLLIVLGEYAWGARIAIFGIAGVVGIFVTGKWADTKAARIAAGENSEEERPADAP